MEFIHQYLQESLEITKALDQSAVQAVIDLFVKTRDLNGRIFFLGVGGSAANCSHAVKDVRKIAGIEAYTPTDNVSELSARTNDSGWSSTFAEWLKTSRLRENDLIFIFSVGGGSKEKNISPNIVEALKLAKEKKASITGIVGRDGGFTAQAADAVLIIPPLFPDRVTPHTESFQLLIWHLIISHPQIMTQDYKWETSTKQ